MILLQHGVGNCAELLRVSRKRHQEYCDKFGIQFVQDFEVRHPERLPYWEKIPLIQSYLDTTDVLLWVDADALIVQDVDLSRILTCDLAMAKARKHGREWFNTGVMFIRNTPEMFALLSDAWDRWPNDVAYNEHPKHDEKAINDACSERGITVQVLDAKYNSWKNNAVNNPVIKAWHGEPDDATRMRFREFLQRVK